MSAPPQRSAPLRGLEVPVALLERDVQAPSLGRTPVQPARPWTERMLSRLDPQAELPDFVARDPYAARCLVDVAAGR